ncbi:hypothetical protein BDQ17DRAFT_332984 [Cyathus striatus]|nr:hypothetical protein BDQ17DRAFT_332984 [Cyathus striatus]
MSLDSHLQDVSPAEESQPLSAVTETPEQEVQATSSSSEGSGSSEQQARDTLPKVYTEPEVPDPFLMDEEGDVLSDNEREDSLPAVSESQRTLSPAHEISLTAPTSPPPNADPLSSPLLPANLNKDVPPPPSTSSESDEEAPDLYLPGLVIPTMFLPIPNVRRSFSNQLTWWLSRNLMYNTCIRPTH